jgi:hypothetical protein
MEKEEEEEKYIPFCDSDDWSKHPQPPDDPDFLNQHFESAHTVPKPASIESSLFSNPVEPSETQDSDNADDMPRDTDETDSSGPLQTPS